MDTETKILVLEQDMDALSKSVIQAMDEQKTKLDRFEKEYQRMLDEIMNNFADMLVEKLKC